MNNWFLLALLSPAIFAINNFIDKYVIEEKVKDYRSIPIYTALVGLIAGCIIWLCFGRQSLPFYDAAIVMLTGVLTVWGYAFYFRALSTSQTSYVIGLFQVIPVLALVLSFIFLGETITLVQFGGFFLVLSSAIALSFQKDKEKFKLNSAFYWVLIADLLFAASSVLFKFAVNANSFTKILSYESWGIALGGLILYIVFPSVRHAFIKTNKEVGKKVMGIMVVNEIVLILAKGIMFLAISLGSVALVSVLGGTQVFYGIVFGLVLTLIAPKIFKEEIGKKHLLKKVILMSLLFLGIWLTK